MSDAEILLAIICVAQGLYISYQWNRIHVIQRTLAFATFALEAAYEKIMEDVKDETNTD